MSGTSDNETEKRERERKTVNLCALAACHMIMTAYTSADNWDYDVRYQDDNKHCVVTENFIIDVWQAADSIFAAKHHCHHHYHICYCYIFSLTFVTTSDASHLLTSKMRSGFLSAENNETFYSFDWQNENTPSAQLFVWSTIEWIIRQQECRKNATQQKEEKGDNVVKPTISLSYRNNVSGKSSDTWPLYSKGQHLRYNGENMSLFLFVSAQMNARRKNCWCHFILLLGGMSNKLCTRLAWISNVHVQNVSGIGKKVRLFVCVFSSR